MWILNFIRGSFRLGRAPGHWEMVPLSKFYELATYGTCGGSKTEEHFMSEKKGQNRIQTHDLVTESEIQLGCYDPINPSDEKVEKSQKVVLSTKEACSCLRKPRNLLDCSVMRLGSSMEGCSRPFPTVYNGQQYRGVLEEKSYRKRFELIMLTEKWSHMRMVTSLRRKIHPCLGMISRVSMTKMQRLAENGIFLIYFRICNKCKYRRELVGNLRISAGMMQQGWRLMKVVVKQDVVQFFLKNPCLVSMYQNSPAWDMSLVKMISEDEYQTQERTMRSQSDGSRVKGQLHLENPSDLNGHPPGDNGGTKISKSSGKAWSSFWSHGMLYGFKTESAGALKDELDSTPETRVEKDLTFQPCLREDDLLDESPWRNILTSLFGPEFSSDNSGDGPASFDIVGRWRRAKQKNNSSKWNLFARISNGAWEIDMETAISRTRDHMSDLSVRQFRRVERLMKEGGDAYSFEAFLRLGERLCRECDPEAYPRSEPTGLPLELGPSWERVILRPRRRSLAPEIAAHSSRSVACGNEGLVPEENSNRDDQVPGAMKALGDAISFAPGSEEEGQPQNG